MTYSSNEKSVQDSNVIELYEFIGTFNTYRYTSYGEDVVQGGHVWSARTMNRDKLEVTNHDNTNNDLKVTIPADDALAREYAQGITPPSLDLTIYRVHASLLGDRQVYFKGKVVNTELNKVECDLISPSIFSFLLRSIIPRIRYSSQCNHQLFDERCKVSRTANNNRVFLIVQTVTDSNTLVLARQSSSSRTGYFTLANWRSQIAVKYVADAAKGGHLTKCARNGNVITESAESRTITANRAATQAGTISLDFNYPFSSVAVGDYFTMTVGCDHILTGDCITKFNNAVNFGGFPFIPEKNPFIGETQ